MNAYSKYATHFRRFFSALLTVLIAGFLQAPVAQAVGYAPDTVANGQYQYSKLAGVVVMDPKTDQPVCGSAADGKSIQGLSPCNSQLQQTVAATVPKGASANSQSACVDGLSTIPCAVVVSAITCFGSGIVGGALYGYAGKDAMKALPGASGAAWASAHLARAIWIVQHNAAVEYAYFHSGDVNAFMSSGGGELTTSTIPLSAGTSAGITATAVAYSVAVCAASGAAGAYAGYKVYYVFSRSKNDIQKR